MNSLRDYVLMGPSEANEPGALRPAATLGPVGRDSLKHGDSRSMALRCVLLTRERQAETPLARRNLAFEPVPIGDAMGIATPGVNALDTTHIVCDTPP